MKLDPITEYILLKNGEDISEGILPDLFLIVKGGKIVVSASAEFKEKAAILATVAGLILAATIGVKLRRFYKDYISKYTKQCRDIKHGSTPSGRRRYTREKCELSVKIKGYYMEVKALNDAKQVCKKSKHPEKCISKLSEKMRKLTLKINKMKLQLKSLEHEKTYAG